MADVIVTTGIVFERGGTTNMARIVDSAGVPITQSSLSAISYSVYNKLTQAVVTPETPLVVSDVVFNLPINDARWTQDEIGYNFRHSLDDTELPEPTATYRSEYRFTPTPTGPQFWAAFEPSTTMIVRP